MQTYNPYDNRNRATSFSWSDGTQGQSFEYDDASRLTRVFNAEANITFGYDDANRKKRETVATKSYGLNVTRAVLYDYDADGNRSRLTYPQGNQYLYAYTQRNQLDTIKLDPALFGAQPALVNYAYDKSGNRISRVAPSGARAEYEIDALNRVDGQTNYFSDGKTIRFDYGFDALGRRRYEQRDNAAADGYRYDPADEVTFYRRDGSLNADGTVSGGSTVVDFDPYDGNGNKTGVRTNGKLDTHVANNLNQYESTTALGALDYDLKGNLKMLQGWSYTYDAQNRLTALDNAALNVHIVQHYDPLNRVIARDNNGVITSYVWDNWNLIEERRGNGTVKRCYVYGAGQNELVQAYEGGVYAKLWYWQDGRGNTAAVSGEAGFLVERYRYDLAGTPSFYDANNVPRSSANDTRFLFAGSLYQPETGLYDMRNRFYHVTLSRFMQTDPVGLQVAGMKPSAIAAAFFPAGTAPEKFGSTELNLYRYCGNDPVNHTDPMGLTIEYDYPNPNDAAATRRLVARLEAMGGEIAARVKQLRDSQNTHRFIPIQPNQSGWEKYNLPPREKGDTINRTVPDENKAARSGRPGTGSKIELDPKNWKDPKGNRRDPVEAAGHEVDHAAAIDQGRRLAEPAEEDRARQLQELIRDKLQESR